MDLDPVILSRIQFAFVVSFHIIFPSFTIGLAAWLATLEGTRLATVTRFIGACSTSG
jgi:cytochrome bd ubiquinol oxidase subunit I